MKQEQAEQENLRTEGKKVRIIYSHSYDRGLEYALSIGWPIIKKSIPDAEFHIAYGWVLFDSIHRNNPERIAWKSKMEKLMKQPGVIHHGRVSQKELIALKSQCVVNYYPSTFEEIDCIGVRESAAVGCIPFTTDYAALEGRAYCVTTKGDPYAKETQEKIAENVVKFIKGEIQIDIPNFMELARNENWENISKLWLQNL